MIFVGSLTTNTIQITLQMQIVSKQFKQLNTISIKCEHTILPSYSASEIWIFGCQIYPSEDVFPLKMYNKIHVVKDSAGPLTPPTPISPNRETQSPEGIASLSSGSSDNTVGKLVRCSFFSPLLELIVLFFKISGADDNMFVQFFVLVSF